MEEFEEVVHAHWIEGQTDNPIVGQGWMKIKICR